MCLRFKVLRVQSVCVVEGVGVGFRVEGLAGFRTFGPRFRSLGFGV